MPSLTEMTEAVREKIRASHAPHPLATPATGSIIHHVSPPPPTSPVLTKALTEAAEDLATTPEEREWHRTMIAMGKLEFVYTWMQEKDARFTARMSLAEGRCRDAARAGNPQFPAYQRKYLDVVGQCCELYAAQVSQLESFDLLSYSLGMQRVRFRRELDLTQPLPDERPTFFFREIPHLLVATPEDLESIIKVKQTFPESQVRSTRGPSGM